MKIHCGYYQRLYIAVFCLPVCIHLSSSQTVLLAGKIVDAATHQPVRDAIVVLLEIGQRKCTTDSGEFCFDHIAPGRYTISAHHIAYAGVERSILCKEQQCDTTIIEMPPALLQSDEVVVAVPEPPPPCKVYLTHSLLKREISFSSNPALQFQMR